MNRLSTIVLALTMTVAAKGQMLSPINGAKGVCVDTHLTLTFSDSVEVGDHGMIRIMEVATGLCIDSLDISIPAGPTEPRTYGPECDYTKVAYDYSRSAMATNRTVRPGTPSGGAEPTPPDYQLNIIGGFTDAFHFYPVIVHGRVATIYLHNNMLEYGKEYCVTIDSGVFRGQEGISDWRFSTKAAAPTATTLTVNHDGSADFCTVQGALDAVPDFSATPYYINIAQGDYEELVYTRNKANVHIKGAGMARTKVHYANCEVFNPHPLTLKTNELPGTFPSRRAAFMLDNCRDMTMENITVATDMCGQAEGLLINGERIALRGVHIIGSGDAMQGNGTIYMERCEMDGGGDTFLGRGAIFLYRCYLRNDGGPFTWIRNTEGHHGDVFVECTFSTFNGQPVDLGRCPSNKGRSYPHAEQVMIRCWTAETIPEGWSAIGEPTAYFAEYDTRNIMTGMPVDTSRRHEWSHQLDGVKDSETIRNYSTPSFVLNGWIPEF